MTEGLMIIAPDGTILYVNRSLQELLQYREDELVGKSCKTLECTSCFDTRSKGKGKHCALFEKGKVKNMRCAFKRKNGEYLQVYKNATVLRNDQGEVVAGVENLTDISHILARELEISTLKRQLHIESSFFGMIGSSTVMQNMFQLIKSAAHSDAPILIYGESGTGKELVASALFQLSKRNTSPFIKVNCSALNESLLESELFGHVKGAFTGAERSRIGRFEAADTGYIFLDEIGDMPIATQTKLLRVFQEKEIERVGDNTTIRIDVRVITATNKNLETLMQQGKFREDLFYRISVIPIAVPSLKDRCEDIPEICKVLINRLQLKTGKPIYGISKEAMDKLLEHSWPGNVRELINVLEYAFVLCAVGIIETQHLPSHLTGGKALHCAEKYQILPAENESERENILEALTSTGGNRTKAAKRLGISRVTLWKKMKKYNIIL